jgi:glycine oxidase
MHDCLIIGGGVIGLSLAYDLASHACRVHVIDQAEMGREASWAGAGILPPANLETAHHAFEQLGGLASQLHPQWAAQLKQETGVDNGYWRCGGIYVARSAGEAAVLRGMIGALDEQRIGVQLLSAREAVELEPGLEGGELVAACFLPDEAQLRNPRHLEALLVACKHRGVVLSEHVSAGRMIISSGKVVAVESNQGRLQAGSVCLTAGAWTYRLLKDLNIPTGIMPVRGQMVLFRCEQPPITHILNEGPRYLVPRRDGHLLVGSTEEEVGFDKSTTAEAIDELTRLAVALVPKLRTARVEKTWAGLRPGSFDGFPYLGQVPGLANAFVAAGHFRGGLWLSPATAVVMSRLIRGQDTGIDLSPFRVGRG